MWSVSRCWNNCRMVKQEFSCRYGRPTIFCPSRHACQCFIYLFNIEIVLLPVSVNKQKTDSTNMDASGHFALQIAAKLLLTATWLPLTSYRNLPTPYPTVPSPTPYDVPFSHSTYITNDRQTTEHTNSLTVLSTVG